MRRLDQFDAVVIGAGLIGSAVAWRAGRLGLRVALADPGLPGAASAAAAGMLAPVAEARYGEEGVLALGLESARRYPEFIADLESDLEADPEADLGLDLEPDGPESGLEPSPRPSAGLNPVRGTQAATVPDHLVGKAGYWATGTLSVAYDRDDGAALAELAEFHQRLGVDSELLTGAQCRMLEPLLAPAVHSGLVARGDHVVDNRRLLAALRTALERTRTPIHRQSVTELLIENGAAAGVRLADGSELRAPQVVLAAGAWSNAIAGLPAGALPIIRPVKGQILRLAVPAAQMPFISRAVHGLVRGRSVYLAPREHGELVIGATSEEAGFDTGVTAGGVYELLRDAHALFPGLGELPLPEISVGLRPCAADNAPVLGHTSLPGLIAATGHYRNGVLLTPVTADLIAGLLAGGELPPWAREFQPHRPKRANA